MQQQDGFLQQPFVGLREADHARTARGSGDRTPAPALRMCASAEHNRRRLQAGFRLDLFRQLHALEYRAGEDRSPCHPGTAASSDGQGLAAGRRRRESRRPLPPSKSRQASRRGFVCRHDQQLLGARPQRVLDGVERGVQVVLGDRFLQVGHGAQRQPAAAVFIAGNDVHRNVARSGIVLQAVQNGPARHVGQGDIERDGARVELARQAESRRCRAAPPAL